MLDRLVLADRPVKYDAVFGVPGGAGERVTADADGLGCYQDALGIQAVQQVLETPAFLTDPVLFGYGQAVDEHFAGIDRGAAHFGDGVHIAIIAVQAGIEQRHSIGGALALFFRRGSGQQHDPAGFLGG